MSPVPLPPVDRRPALRPPQFRLATLLWVVAFLCGVLAAMKFVGPLGAFALVLFVFSVLAHIWGNALGTQLRACGDQPVDEQDRPLGASRIRYGSIPPSPAPSKLTQRQRIGIVLTLIVASGLLLGASGGVWWTVYSQPSASIQDLSLASIAFGVLGGIWGLIAGGFLLVGVAAVREAIQGGRSTMQK